jgi:predicted RNase H-like HicB family nuclease
MKFYALVDEMPGDSMVFFRALPGCFSAAPTAEEAVSKAPEAIFEYLNWLKEQNIFFLEEEVSEITLEIKEHLQGGRVGPRFEADLPAPTNQEIDHALSVAVTVRTLLIGLYNGVPLGQRGRVLPSEEWSLTDHLRHILEAEAYYIWCISDRPKDPTPHIAEADLPQKLFENAREHETFLHSLTPEQRACVHVHGEAEWTAVKVLRRMTTHLRQHYPWMQAIAHQLSL